MTPDLIGKIAHNLPLLDGWCTIEKGEALAGHILRLGADVTVEIGVYGGRSLIPMALAHAEQNRGVVWGIDAWDPSVSIENEVQANAEWWGKLDHNAVRVKFLGHLNRLGLEPFVKVIHARSDAVEPPERIDVLHVDGSHTDQSIRDVERFAPRVRDGGVVFMDDIHWAGGGVERAVEKLKSMGFNLISSLDTGGFFERVAVPVAQRSTVRLPGSSLVARKKIRARKLRNERA